MKKVFKKITIVLFIGLICLLGAGCANIEQPQWLKEKICEHNFSEEEIIKEATCTTKGVKVEICSDCGQTKIGRFKALGHDVQIDAAVLPTCEESGLTEGSHCGRCNEILTPQKYVPLQDHTVVTLEGVAATCGADGKTDGKICSVCETVIIAPEIISKDTVAHDFHYKEIWAEPRHSKTCSVCGLYLEEDHAPNDWVTEGTVGVDIRDVLYCDCGVEMEDFKCANVDENGQEIVIEIDLQVADLQDETSTVFQLVDCISEKIGSQDSLIIGLYNNGDLIMDLEELANNDGVVPASIFQNVLGEHVLELLVFTNRTKYGEHVVLLKFNVVNNYHPCIDENNDLYCDVCEKAIEES